MATPGCAIVGTVSQQLKGPRSGSPPRGAETGQVRQARGRAQRATRGSPEAHTLLQVAYWAVPTLATPDGMHTVVATDGGISHLWPPLACCQKTTFCAPCMPKERKNKDFSPMPGEWHASCLS
jgi:hypothetical protein